MKFPIPEEALKRHMAIVGMTGAGKSTTGRTIIEHVYDEGHNICILDTIKSDWWGLTSSADGKKAGLPFKILGGPRGHYRLPSSAGKVMGQLIGSGKLPHSIIDMADFEPGGAQRFFVDFAPSLMRNMKGILYLFIEEAHELAPKERAGFDKENMGVHYAKRIATGSRSRGIRMIVATQRVQSLHNAVLGSCETIITHRIGFHDDQVPVIKWMKSKIGKENAAEVENEIANLPDGVAYVAAGAPVKIFERVKMPLFRTFDNTKTPDGVAQIEVKTSPVDHEEIAKLIGDGVKEAEDNDVGKLQVKVRKLEADLAKKPATVAAAPIERTVIQSDPVEIRKAHRAGFDSGFAIGATNAFQIGAENIMQIARDVTDVAAKFDRLRDGPKKPHGYPEYEIKQSGPSPAPPPVRPPMRSVAAPRAQPSPVTGGDGTELTGPMQRVLDSIAFWSSIGKQEPSRSQVAFVANYSPKTSGYEKALGLAKTAGFIAYPSPGRVALSSEGSAIARAMSRDEATAAIKTVLSAPQMNVVSVLVQTRDPISREELAEATNYSAKTSGYEKTLGQLNTLQIAYFPAPRMVQITDWAKEMLS